MNNDLLAGILGGLIGEMPLSMPANRNGSSEPGDFMQMLNDRLADETVTSMSNEAKHSVRSSLYTGQGSYNPLLSVKSGYSDDTRPDQFKNKSTRTGFNDDLRLAKQSVREDDAAKGQADKASAEKARLEAKIASKNTADSSAMRPETDAENKKAQQNSELEKLLNSFSNEDKAALIDTLQRLSPEDLAALAQSPDEFAEKLAELVMEMPDSSAKNELLVMVQSPEFLQLMQALADQQDGTLNQDSSQASLATTSEINNAEPTAGIQSQLADSQVSEDVARQSVATDEVTSRAASDLAAALKQEQAVDSGETSETEKQGDDEAGNDKTTTRNTTEKNVETRQESAAIESPKNRESLREEFKRENQSANEAKAESQQTEPADEPTFASKPPAQANTTQPATPEQTKATIEETARKFFSLFSEKSTGGDKATTAATYSPEAIKRHSNIGNNSAGNGSNGFSSHTGTSANSMSAARPAAPAPAANHIFSQMLEKAEYLKTHNGSKILNMEFDPGELGKLEMELTSKDGTVSARISAESAMAKAKLDELTPQIKEQLLNQGINLTEITVDISSKNPDERYRDQMSGGQNKSARILAADKEAADAIIRKNILPNLRRAALNIKAVDLTV